MFVLVAISLTLCTIAFIYLLVAGNREVRLLPVCVSYTNMYVHLCLRRHVCTYICV